MLEEIRVITKEQYNEYMELKKQAKTTQTKRWKPKDMETYWYIYGDGTIDSGFWISKNETLGRYKLGNCFRTKEEAQKELDRSLAEQELLDMCDWEGGDQYNLLYNFKTKTFNSVYSLNFIQTPYRFASKESARKAIDTLGTEKLKLIFRIN